MATGNENGVSDQPGTLNTLPASERTSTQNKISKQEKLDKILDLSVAGASVRQISDRLTAMGWTGCKRSQVGKLLKEALDIGREELKLKAADHIELELQKEQVEELAILPNLLRLLDLDKSCILAGESKHADDIERYSKSLERVTRRRDVLLNLQNKSTKVEVEVPTATDGNEVQIRVILPAAHQDEEPD